MSVRTLFAQRQRQARQGNRRHGAEMKPVTASQIEAARARIACTGRPVAAWRSRDFLAQLYIEDSGNKRLSICRTELRESTCHDGWDWKDGITWDELNRIKGECGFLDSWAIEIYPPESRIVNVASIRHLWLLDQAPDQAWKKEPNK